MTTRGAVRLLTVALLTALPLACSPTDSTTPPPLGLPGNRAPLSAGSLGVAASFVVLGGSTVTNTGPTVVQGDLGLYPGTAVIGFPPGLVSGGVTHAADAVALQAQADVTSAYITLAGQACDFSLTGQDLGGKTLVPGVYCFTSSAQLTGTLVLNGQGNPDAVFIFQIASTLTTASNASVTFINGGQSCHTFWQVGSSATLGTGTSFAGSILALTSITLTTGANVSGRTLARNGAVTLDSNQISAPACTMAVDAGVPVIDAGTPTVDAGSPFVDAGTPFVDAGTPFVDAGTPYVDAGTPYVDAGTPYVDAGTPYVDGGTQCCLGTICGVSCTYLGGDVNNCGACGHACGSGEFCAGGTCLGCSPLCNGQCVDLTGDHNNCGACNVACGATEACSNGSCVPCAHVCNGVCVDTTSDDTNCGACGNNCAPSEACNSGVCTSCATTCYGYCTDLITNALNCGSCGNMCASGESCNAGVCECMHLFCHVH